jgi:hypothetical protein
MSNGDTHVRPGEVISSSLINQILDRLAALEAGASGPAPGNGGPIVIDSFEPEFEVNVGRLLAIAGSGLPFPPTATSVTIGGFPVTLPAYLPTSTSARLEFIVPSLGTMPPEGRDLFVRVRNGVASAQRLYHFLPAIDESPVPNITGVHPPSQPDGTPIQIGTQTVVDGSNFAAAAASNQITMVPLGVSNPQTYPRPDAPLVFDTAGSNTQRVIFTMPDIVEITTAARRVRLELRNGANPVAAVREFFVFR